MAKRQLDRPTMGITSKFECCGHIEIYLTVNFFQESCDPAEIFIKVAKFGSMVRGFINVVAILASQLLRNGVAWQDVKRYLCVVGFDPSDEKHASLLHAIADEVDRLIVRHAFSTRRVCC